MLFFRNLSLDLLSFDSIKQRIETLSIDNVETAKLLCRSIPGQCPFAREIRLFNRTILRIPPLCKLNPFYDQLMVLRFRALSYLAAFDRA
jgi:hypothetical protein